jgi:hypothetical protein
VIVVESQARLHRISQIAWRPGVKFVLESVSLNKAHGAVFEDDGDTGYFYCLDFSVVEQPIVDALHIYNCAEIADAHIRSSYQIGWSADGLKALLSINDYPHAVADFEAKKAYCRNGFPPAVGAWKNHDHSWTDHALDLFDWGK